MGTQLNFLKGVPLLTARACYINVHGKKLDHWQILGKVVLLLTTTAHILFHTYHTWMVIRAHVIHTYAAIQYTVHAVGEVGGLCIAVDVCSVVQLMGQLAEVS